jgi:hypothetical protein
VLPFHERRVTSAVRLTAGIASGHDATVYVLALILVAAIVNWLVDTVLATLTASVVVPSLQRARRASLSAESGVAYERSVAGAALVRYVLDACAVGAACLYYADNNLPRWPAWAVLGVFLAAFHVPRSLAALGRLVRVSRSAV